MKATRFIATFLFVSLAASLWSQALRGPLVDRLEVGAGTTSEVSFGMEEIVLVELAGDSRFIEAVELTLEAPAAVSSVSGAVSFTILAPAVVSQNNEIADVVGQELLLAPLQRGGTTFYQVRLRNDADPSASAAVRRIDRVVPASQFPIALSVVTRMKGLAPEVYNADFSVTVEPIVRDVGLLHVTYSDENDREVEPSLATPDFALTIDGEEVAVQPEYLLPPGLHRVALTSDRYENQRFTVGVERGKSTELRVPLIRGVATVRYTAPDNAQVYLNGQLLPESAGDFTVEPGAHTIVVVIGEYTVTRRFRVQEQREYSLSLTMDIVVEEVN